MSERSERLAASEASLAEKVVRSTTDQLVLDMLKNFQKLFFFLVKRLTHIA